MVRCYYYIVIVIIVLSFCSLRHGRRGSFLEVSEDRPRESCDRLPIRSNAIKGGFVAFNSSLLHCSSDVLWAELGWALVVKCQLVLGCRVPLELDRCLVLGWASGLVLYSVSCQVLEGWWVLGVMRGYLPKA